MNETFSILIDNKSRPDAGDGHGTWLDMPATKEQLHAAMESIGITERNAQDFFISRHADTGEHHFALPYEIIRAASVDELNYLAARLTELDPAELPKLNAALQQKNGAETVAQMIDLTYNLDYYIHAEAQTPRELGDYYLNKSGAVQMPDEWKRGIDLSVFGQNAAESENGVFVPPYGYLSQSSDEWEIHYDGREVPEEYRIMSYPSEPKAAIDYDMPSMAAEVIQSEPIPVKPIILTAEKPAEKLKEITDRLEKGIMDLFDSERYKEYLGVMSKFHNYSFNNMVLIALQKPDASLVMGFNAWKGKGIERNVKKGEQGIRIFAPAPYKIKRETERIAPDTKMPMLGADGKPLTELTEVTVPAFKVVSVFDVSQTEGKELPTLGVDTLLGNVEQYEDFFKALQKTSPVPIDFEKIEGGAHGYYHLEDKRIALDEGMSELQTLKTAIHEIAHAKLHDIDLNALETDTKDRPDRRTREVQAESVAYTVCQHYGLDTSDYSFGYVAGWSKGRELDELKGSLETICTAAAEIIDSIDAHLAEIQKEREAAQLAIEDTELPDPSITIADMNAYGYSWDGMLPLRADAAEQLFNEDLQIYRLYADGHEGAIERLDELREHAEGGGIFGVHKEDYEALRDFKALQAELAASEPSKEGLLLHGKEDSYGIYQIPSSEQTRELVFEPYDRLLAMGHEVDRANYQLVYTAPLTPGTTLENIYEKFNIDHPADYKGRSLSLSDVVVLHQGGDNTAHYVDSVGFYEVPQFLGQTRENILSPAEHTTGESISTPRGSFHVTDMTEEQMRAAGFGVHHTSEDGKYLIMGNGTQAYAVSAEPQNPLKHIEDTVEQNDNKFDGIINNTPTPTVDALEAKVKASETISLVDLANAIKADKARGKDGAKSEKPSIREQLKQSKTQAAKKTAAKTKKNDLEV